MCAPLQLHQLHLEGIPGTWDSSVVIFSFYLQDVFSPYNLASLLLSDLRKGENMHIAARQGSWAALWALCLTKPPDSYWYQLGTDRLPCHMEDVSRDMSPPCCAKSKHCFGH